MSDVGGTELTNRKGGGEDLPAASSKCGTLECTDFRRAIEKLWNQRTYRGIDRVVDEQDGRGDYRRG